MTRSHEGGHPGHQPRTLRRPAARAGLGVALIVVCAACGLGADAERTRGDAVPAVCGPLRVAGQAIVYPDGSRFTWTGITAFALLDQIADGRSDDTDAFMRWARGRGFNLVRVLAMANSLFRLPPADGLAALPRLLEMAAQHDLYVEVVALADTRAYGMDRDALRAQVAAVAQVSARYPNALVQIANEHAHPTQVDALHDPAFVSSLASAIPAAVLYTDAPPPDDRATRPQGMYLTRHLDRGGDPWAMVSRVRVLAGLSTAVRKPVVSDEPIGAAERREPGRRLADPAVFFAMGALGRIFGVGTTFHCEDCLQARVPGRVQQECADAFIKGTTLVPDDVSPAFHDARAPGSPVADAAVGRGVVQVYSGVAGARGWTLALGLRGDPAIAWAPGWSPTRVVYDKPGIRVWEIARRTPTR